MSRPANIQNPQLSPALTVSGTQTGAPWDCVLPEEVILNIMASSEGTQVPAIGLASRGFRAISQDNYLWRLLFEQKFKDPSLPVSKEDYLETYKKEQLLNNNIKNGISTLEYFSGHEDSIAVVIVDNDQICSGSDDHTIKIWDHEKKECRTLYGHEGEISCLAPSDQELFSGSYDTTIRRWDKGTGACTGILEGHNGEVTSIVLADRVLFSSSNDRTIRAWDLDTGKCTQVFWGHEEAVNTLVMADGTLISGGDEGLIILWDVATGKPIKILNAHEDAVTYLLVAKGKLFSGSADGSIKMWDIKTGACLKTVIENQNAVSAIAFGNGRLFSCFSDAEIAIWDVEQGACTARIQRSPDGILSLAFKGGKLYSGSIDGALGIWNFGVSERELLQVVINYFRTEEAGNFERAIGLFSAMTKKTQEKIYAELYHILYPVADDEGTSEDAFHNRNGSSCSLEEKAQAIENYINEVPRVTISIAKRNENPEDDANPSLTKRAKKT